MSIEDVNYLKNNCSKESVLIYIDSHKRDMQTYPTPANYVVQFEEPFKLVCGFEVLDVSLPCVMYNIDSHNDTLAYSTLADNECPITFHQWISECQYVPFFDPVFSGLLQSEIMLCTPEQWALVDGPIASAPLTSITSSTYTYMVMVRAVRPDVVILDASLAAHDASLFVVQQGRRVAISKTDYPEVYAAWKDGLMALPADGTDGVVIYQGRLVDSSTTDILRAANAYLLDLYNSVKKIERGNYNINTLLLTLTSALASSGITLSSATSGNVEKDSRYLYKCSNAFMFDMTKSTCRNVLGFSTLAFENDTAGSYSRVAYNDNQRLFFSVVNDVRGYEMIGPGIVNMTGMQYVLLRCPEIEDHMQMSSVNQQNMPGLGIFKLASGNDVSYLRFDFVSLARKEFHPIGKLSRLTLSFLMPDADRRLYDFKGVDHQILVNLKYYKPGKQDTNFKQSVLNPQYNPNYLEYMTRQLANTPSTRLDPRQDDKKCVSSSDDSDSGEDDSDYSSSDDEPQDPRLPPRLMQQVRRT